MWKFAAALSRGTSHVKSGMPCQDRYASTVLQNGTLVAAIADGAGSAKYSDRGAEVAVATVVKAIRGRLFSGRGDFEALVRESVLEARAAVIEEAGSAHEPPREFASTLLVAAVGPQGGGAAQIGDGVIVVNGASAGWSWVFWPQRGEYANATYFLTDEVVEEHLQAEAFVGDISSIAMMSDGLEPLTLHYETRSAHAPFFDGMFGVLHGHDGIGEAAHLSQGLERYLASDPVTARTDDDVSLILATRLPGALSTP